MMMRKKTHGRGKSVEFDPQQPPEIAGVSDMTLVGRGGSASVYKGQETALRRTVAVKVLHTQLREGDEQRAFRLECEHAGQVGEHPYAADVYRNGFADGWPFLVMRYYARGSLASTVQSAGQQPVGDTLTICASMATALQYAHNLGILHRDVKPENILRDAYGAPVLADFGIATGRDAASRSLRHAMTPAYAAPEVLQHGGGWPHSDVWSLAATLYALLAGHPPFYDPRQGDPQANLRALAGPLPAIGRPDVPGHVLETLSRALIGRPDTRTASARRFAEELNVSLELLGQPPVPILVDGPATGGLSVHPGPVPLLSPLPAAADNAGGRAGPYATSTGFTTTTGPVGFAGGHATPPPQPLPQAYESAGTVNGLPTGYLSTHHAYRQPGQPPGRGTRNRVPRAAIAGGGGALVLVILVVAYLLAVPRHPATDTASSTSATSAPANSMTGASAGGTSTASAAAGGTPTQATYTPATATASAAAGGTSTSGTSTSATSAAGPPVVSSVAVSAVTVGVGEGAEVDVTATVDPGGEPLSSCTVTVTLSDDSGSGSGACGSAVIIDVPMYNTSYTASVTATTNDGTSTATGTGTSSLKELTADATTAFGDSPYTSAFETDESIDHPVPIIRGSVVTAECWASGLGISGDDAAYPSGTDYYDWVEITSPDIGYYMSELYFPDPSDVTAGLPSC